MSSQNAFFFSVLFFQEKFYNKIPNPQFYSETGNDVIQGTIFGGLFLTSESNKFLPDRSVGLWKMCSLN